VIDSDAAAILRLVAAGVSPDTVFNGGVPALSNALSGLSIGLCEKRDDAVQALLIAKANPDMLDREGFPPLFYATLAHAKAVPWLCDAGADVRLGDCLLVAAEYGRYAAFTALYERGALVDLDDVFAMLDSHYDGPEEWCEIKTGRLGIRAYLMHVAPTPSWVQHVLSRFKHYPRDYPSSNPSEWAAAVTAAAPALAPTDASAAEAAAAWVRREQWITSQSRGSIETPTDWWIDNVTPSRLKSDFRRKRDKRVADAAYESACLAQNKCEWEAVVSEGDAGAPQWWLRAQEVFGRIHVRFRETARLQAAAVWKRNAPTIAGTFCVIAFKWHLLHLFFLYF
jgi:hypothetical protein